MPSSEDYPPDYRAEIVAVVDAAARAGESVSIVGLSGAGKSNLLKFLAQRARPADEPVFVLVDGNRLTDPSPTGYLELMRRALERAKPHADDNLDAGDALEALDSSVGRRLAGPGSSRGICFLLDMSLLVSRTGSLFGDADRGFFNNLRAVRDAHKYRVTYVAAMRHPLPPDTELAELFHGHTLWLGALSARDAAWTVRRYAARTGHDWDKATANALCAASGAYPALLRAVCEAHASRMGRPVDAAALAEHPAVRARLEEFWADGPTEAELHAAGLLDNAMLMAGRADAFDTTTLTAKEHHLLEYFQAHAGQVCEKDDLIRAVWPEDRVQTQGVRDDSLAQLVRRLREKIETDPSSPRHVHTVPGRGYRFVS